MNVLKSAVNTVRCVIGIANDKISPNIPIARDGVRVILSGTTDLAIHNRGPVIRKRGNYGKLVYKTSKQLAWRHISSRLKMKRSFPNTHQVNVRPSTANLFGYPSKDPLPTQEQAYQAYLIKIRRDVPTSQKHYRNRNNRKEEDMRTGNQLHTELRKFMNYLSSTGKNTHYWSNTKCLVCGREASPTLNIPSHSHPNSRPRVYDIAHIKALFSDTTIVIRTVPVIRRRSRLQVKEILNNNFFAHGCFGDCFKVYHQSPVGLSNEPAYFKLTGKVMPALSQNEKTFRCRHARREYH